jgi:hypothetical protein
MYEMELNFIDKLDISINKNECVYNIAEETDVLQCLHSWIFVTSV